MKTTAFNTKIEMSEPTLKVYRLMYKFGAWVTKATLAAESDREAIHDADELFNTSRLQNWEFGVKLFCENRVVKTYR